MIPLDLGACDETTLSLKSNGTDIAIPMQIIPLSIAMTILKREILFIHLAG